MNEVSEQVRQRLRTDQRAWIATIGAGGGAPHVTPVWFVYEPQRWWVSAFAASVKVANIAAEPQVTLALEDGVHPVVAQAHATIHREPFPQRIAAAFAVKYGGWDIRASPGPERVLIEAVQTRWLLAGVAQ